MAKRISATYPNTINFRPLIEAMDSYTEGHSPEKVLWHFVQFSEFLENCLRDIGIARFTRDNVKVYPTGELLCVATTTGPLISKFMCDLTDRIVVHVDHPMTEFCFEGKGNGVFETAHQAACEWLAEIRETHLMQADWFMECLDEGRMNWLQLTATEQARFADIEVELARFEATPRVRLAVQVRQERLKYLNAIDPSPPGNKRLVTVAEVAKFLGILSTSVSPKKSGWPTADSPPSGRTPAKWDWATLRPVLEEKNPLRDWSSF